MDCCCNRKNVLAINYGIVANRMDGDLFIQKGLVIPESELGFTASRSGGPGGQHANKTSSRVTIVWDVLHSVVLNDWQRERLLKRLAGRMSAEGVLQLDVDETRSQYQNRVLARLRLAALVVEALKVEKRRIATRPGKRAQERRLEKKKARGEIKKNRKRPDYDG